jgi:pimeloyl-ACP methyl ester carboxylesterase
MAVLVRVMRGGSPESLTDTDVAHYRRAWSQPGALTAMVNWYRAARSGGGWLAGQTRIHTPTLVIWGMKDPALSHRMARPSIDYCENGQLVLIPDAAHWLHREAAEEINTLLLEFLGRGPNKRAATR